MKITILGCGPSVGIPSIGCACGVCKSTSPYNKRMRTSALIEHEGATILIDSSPDFRTQAIANNISSIDAVLYTHPHADHCGGITELQAIEPKDGKKFLPIYGSFSTLNNIVSSYPQLFIPNTPNTPWNKCHYLIINRIDHYVEFYIGNCKIVAFPQTHGNMISTGFIFNNSVAYCTDVKEFPEKAWDMLKNKKTLILGCIGYEKTFAHAHLDLCAKWIQELNPQRAILTHMSHYIDYHVISDYLKKEAPQVAAAYDGLIIECSLV